MGRFRHAASALMLLSGVTHTAHFLFFEPSSANTPVGFAFGLCYFAIGVLLLRPRPLALWLGAIVPGIGAVLAGLARIRDVEVGPDGAIYLLLEHASGARIVRLVPA